MCIFVPGTHYLFEVPMEVLVESFPISQGHVIFSLPSAKPIGQPVIWCSWEDSKNPFGPGTCHVENCLRLLRYDLRPNALPQLAVGKGYNEYRFICAFHHTPGYTSN